jgi:hypothetical protein
MRGGTGQTGEERLRSVTVCPVPLRRATPDVIARFALRLRVAPFAPLRLCAFAFRVVLPSPTAATDDPAQSLALRVGDPSTRKLARGDMGGERPRGGDPSARKLAWGDMGGERPRGGVVPDVGTGSGTNTIGGVGFQPALRRPPAEHRLHDGQDVRRTMGPSIRVATP